MERAGKEISQITVQQKKHAFFGNGVLRKIYGKKQYGKRKTEKG
jgi:hypothetical protein